MHFVCIITEDNVLIRWNILRHINIKGTPSHKNVDFVFCILLNAILSSHICNLGKPSFWPAFFLFSKI